MKKNNIKKGLFTALLLASPFVTAGTQYPAADFQPKVLFQDTEYQHAESAGNSNASTAAVAEKAKADPNFPAATFQPKVLFQDTEYKHTANVGKPARASTTAAPAAKRSLAEAQLEVIESVQDEESSANPLFAIIILIAAGLLYTSRSKGKQATAVSAPAGGLTGVAKYLEANQPAPKSGVAKYVAKKVVASKKAAAEKATGVEKYVRNNNRG